MSQRPALGCLFEVVETLVLTLLIFLVIQNFVAQPYQVKQQSMERTLEPGQYVLVDKLTPRWSEYERGDIVVFHAPEGFRPQNDVPFIKRVIGLPGDTVEIDDGTVFLNGKALDEPYVPADYRDHISREPLKVGPGQYYVLGDHRIFSNDSRMWGTVPRKDIYGKAVFVYWPLDKLGRVR